MYVQYSKSAVSDNFGKAGRLNVKVDLRLAALWQNYFASNKPSFIAR